MNSPENLDKNESDTDNNTPLELNDIVLDTDNQADFPMDNNKYSRPDFKKFLSSFS